MTHLPKRRYLQAFGLISILILAVLLGACGAKSAGERGSNANAATSNEPTIPITVGKSEGRQVASTISATGSLIANETSDVAPKVAGKVANVYANVGQFVGQGATLAKLDDSDALQRLTAARAGVAQAQAAVRQAEARLGLGANGKFSASAVPEVRAASANYEQALAELRQAQANEKRYRELVESGDVAMITYDQYRTARDTAQARADAARQALEAAVNAAKQNNQAIASAQAGVQAAQAQVGIAEQAVADTVVRAPFSGFITARPVAVGEYVASSNPIVTMVKTNPIKVNIQIAEADVPYVAVGRGVSITVDAYKDRRFAGTVSAINQAIDPTSRSAIVEAQIQNDDNALKPGMFATAQISREGGATGVFVPKSAVFSDPTTNSYRVFTIDNGIAKLRVVQLGTEEGDSY
ncbi:MAG TPA: efflux RND transporter periplasmic adaptor subunit, partial [Pyrinomonadaceae bacterium]|nr:efflux RND transporter periplasmic adaptor subunit [Pyrinomonadaceae bacterium]